MDCSLKWYCAPAMCWKENHTGNSRAVKKTAICIPSVIDVFSYIAPALPWRCTAKSYISKYQDIVNVFQESNWNPTPFKILKLLDVNGDIGAAGDQLYPHLLLVFLLRYHCRAPLGHHVHQCSAGWHDGSPCPAQSQVFHSHWESWHLHQANRFPEDGKPFRHHPLNQPKYSRFGNINLLSRLTWTSPHLDWKNGHASHNIFLDRPVCFFSPRKILERYTKVHSSYKN